ncbi:MAG: hypothetical protein Fur0021_09740 [Candidatus Promineifilaceae bacterium]
MQRWGQQANWLLAAVAFLVTLAGLLLGLGAGNLLLSWASFLAAVAVILGALNLLLIHLRRVWRGNVYSAALVLSLLAVLAMPLTDRLGWTQDGAAQLFAWVQAPLEAALAALLVFFLLFAGMRLMRRGQRVWTVLFLLTAILVLLGSAPLPGAVGSFFVALRQMISGVVVNAGMRGILIGVALGAITMSLRLLAGAERPYNNP